MTPRGSAMMRCCADCDDGHTTPESSLSEGHDTPTGAPPTVGRYAYLFVGALLTAYVSALFAVVRFAREPEPRVERILGPMFACASLTALVWLAMVVLRNWAVMTKRANPRYFLAYREAAPPDF